MCVRSIELVGNAGRQRRVQFTGDGTYSIFHSVEVVLEGNGVQAHTSAPGAVNSRRTRGSIGYVHIGTYHVVVTYHQFVVAADVPVQTCQNFVVLNLERIPIFVFARIVFVFADQVLLYSFQVGFRCTGNKLRLIGVAVRAGSPSNTGSVFRFKFTAQEKEQFVLDEGTGHTYTIRLLTCLIHTLDLYSVYGFSLHSCKTLVRIGRCLDFVGTALCYCVNGSTGKAGLTDVVRCNVDGYFFNSI